MAGLKHRRKAKTELDMQNQYLNAAFSEFIRAKEGDNLAKETIDAYKTSYKKFVDCFGDKVDYTGDMSAGIFDDWKKVMANEGLAQATINHNLTCLRTFMYWCMADGRKYIEPFKIRLIKVQEQKPKDYTLEEVEKLLKRPDGKAKFTEWRAWAICSFVIGTSARLSTIINIQMKDLDLKEGTVNYQHTKNKKLQVSNMSPKLIKSLREYINKCFEEEEIQPDDYLFCNVSGEKLSKASLYAGYKKYALSRGVNKSNIHGLRHTFAREWYLSGGDVVQLSKILGHSTLAMSEHYMNVYATMAKDRFIQHNLLENISRKGRGTTKRKVKEEEE